jgi:FkbM family methyltransferase
MSLRLVERAARRLRNAATEILKGRGRQETWIDVGAHHGEDSLWCAEQNPGVKVYAFEPNLREAAKLLGRTPNFFVIPMAVAERDGHAEFHVNRFAAASSLLPMSEDARKSWIGGEALAVESTTTVPTIRLDTFMNLAEISSVDFLKIDAQGMDLTILKSAGKRLRDVAKITVEVDVSPRPLYVGSPSKQEVLAFLQNSGFGLLQAQQQTSGQEENLTFVRVK